MSDTPKPESAVSTQPSSPAPKSVAPRFPGEDVDPVRDRGGDIVYRPLSSFNIAAFGIAAVYTAIVILCAIVAAIERKPLLMGGWSAMFPILAIVLAAVGWFQIQASEGTRTGKSLAIWAITLSIVVSLGYWAYYTATYFVVRGQAYAFCQQYFDKIKEGKLESAFLMTVVPKQRPPREDAGLRDAIEHRFNMEPPGQGRPGGGGYFNIFKEHMLTHVIVQGGKDAEIQPMGVASWEFAGGGGGYVVHARYRVTTPDMTYDALVAVKSTEPQGKEAKGRQWNISLPETTNDAQNHLTPSDEGRKVLALQRSAGKFLREWQARLRTMQQAEHVECYLATLDPAERASVAAAYKKSLTPAAAALSGFAAADGWSGFAAACGATFATEAHLPGYAAFAGGEFVQPAADFWARDEELREKALAGARQLFHTTADFPLGVMHIDPNKIAYWSRGKDKVQFRHHVQLRTRTLVPSIEGEILSECPASVLENGPTPDCWRVVGIKLNSLRATSQGAPASGSGRQPGHPGFGGLGSDK